MNDRFIRAGFWAAAIFNIAGILVFSKGFTNEWLFSTDPVMFSRPGCVLVMVWGLAYWAQSRTWREAPAISAVFALEKFIYAGWWMVWISQHAATLGSLFERDLLAGAFYSLYGVGDACLGCFSRGPRGKHAAHVSRASDAATAAGAATTAGTA